MALRNILTDQDPTLYKVSRPVTEFNERLHILLDDMQETLAKANGAGLAAPQVGVLRRAVLVSSSTPKFWSSPASSMAWRAACPCRESTAMSAAPTL